MLFAAAPIMMQTSGITYPFFIRELRGGTSVLLHWLFNATTHITLQQLECGPMPNVMAALLNIGGALC